jgi:hypothetical protein
VKVVRIRRYIIVTALLAICILLASCSSSNGDSPKESIPKVVVGGGESVPISADSGKVVKAIPPAYSILSDEDISFDGYIRRRVRIVVPLGLSKEILEGNLKHAAYSIYDKTRPNAVMVFAYREDDQEKSSYSAGRCILAPDGEWKKANQKVSRSELKAVVDLAEAYFSPSKAL